MAASSTLRTRLLSGHLLPRLALVGLVLVLAWVVYRAVSPDYREVRLAVPEASGIEPLMDVRIGGTVAGRIEEIELQDGRQPIVTLGIDRDAPPLREDATAVIEYKSLLGERYVALSPGSTDLPALEDGALLTSTSERVDVDQVLQELDGESRDELVRLIRNTREAVEDRDGQIAGVLEGAGPAVSNTSEVLAALGDDQEALRELVTATSSLVGEMSRQREAVGRSVEQASVGMREISARSESLATGLEPLPDTMGTLRSTLVDLDAAVEETAPMLRDLRPVTADLGPLAADLQPTVADLRRTVTELRPALASAPPLLEDVTGMLDRQLPGLSSAGASVLDQTIPIVDFMRPYTPEIAGWASNWAGSSMNYDSEGYYVRVPGKFGRGSIAGAPLDLTFSSMPGQRVEASRAPGQLEGQPVEGANRPPEELR